MSNSAILPVAPVATVIAAFLFVCPVLWPAGASGQVISLFGDEIEDVEFERDEGDQADEGSGESDGDEGEEGETSGVIVDRGTGGGAGVGVSRAIRLEYDQHGSAILVPARVGTEEVYLIFDTGATYTTLTEDFARQARVSPPADGPRGIAQTAGGLTETRFGLIQRLGLGDQTLTNVTYSICDPCGGIEYRGRPVVGLLGMNVLRRYRVSMDGGVVELMPSSNYADRSGDIEPWVTAEFAGTWVRSDRGRPEAQFRVENLSSRQVRGVVVELVCTNRQGEEWEARTQSLTLAAGAHQDVTFQGSAGGGCMGYQTRVVQGRW